jgi:alpha-ketoglutarate-dependent taurine dioxygenase
LSNDGLYWAPWRRRNPHERHGWAIFQKFKQLTEQTVEAMRLRLQPGEMLLVDNRRMLHGRAALPPHSRRLLHRWWIGQKPTRY